MVTLEEVAAAAGVSITTASRVLNGVKFAERIGAARAAHVREVAQRMGYVTNYHHRSLRMGRTESIGVVIDIGTPGERRHAKGLIGNPYFAGLIAGMEAAAIEAGYGLILMGPKIEQLALQRAIEAIRERRVDGVIVPTARPRPGWEQVLRANEDMAIGLIDSPYPSGLPTVRFDHEGGMRLIAEHLAQLGHKRLAWVCIPENQGVELQRSSALRQAGQSLGMQVQDWTGDWTAEFSRHRYIDPSVALSLWAEGIVARRWADASRLPPSQRPTAVVCYSDAIAHGAIRSLLAAGVRIPRDISVTGFDGVESTWCIPAVTSIDHQFTEMGRRVCDIVIARSLAVAEANGKPLGPAETAWIRPELIVRESTGPAPAD